MSVLTAVRGMIVPAGYIVLPRGETRRIRVNTSFLRDPINCKPWRVIGEDGITQFFDDVIIHGTSYGRIGFEARLVDGVPTEIPCAWIETTCDVFVR